MQTGIPFRTLFVTGRSRLQTTTGRKTQAAIRRGLGICTVIGLSVAGLLQPHPADAGIAHVSVDVTFPQPVPGFPAPPVVVASRPTAFPPPVIRYQPPAVVGLPVVTYYAPGVYVLPYGVAKRYYDVHPHHWRSHRHHWRHQHLRHHHHWRRHHW